ncbi:MAG: hypothetical protein BWY96_03180 [Spirochaetes bacterium ADurb.BinA120]|nr:MAG: hypothetical protein BWY96_03180 [Spirochaetes bacterium ADurb.BinA120]
MSRSAALPTLIMRLKRIPLSPAEIPSMLARDPLWERKAVLPSSLGIPGKKERPLEGEYRPMQLGPIILMPPSRALCTRSSSVFPPSSPFSLKPELKTTAALTPLAMQSSTRAGTLEGCTDMMTRSTGPSIAPTLGIHLIPMTSSSLEFTAYSFPLKPMSMKL